MAVTFFVSFETLTNPVAGVKVRPAVIYRQPPFGKLKNLLSLPMLKNYGGKPSELSVEL